jgi:2-polyprenyl-6-hydroxyphenyl methylase/3-demethylubiquinone-9 3-methyltransferase
MNSKPIHPNAVDLHDAMAKEWEQKYTHPRFQRRAAQFFRLVSGVSVAGQLWLDAGCGTGHLLRQLLERDCKVIGVDASKEMLHAAQRLTGDGKAAPHGYCRIRTIGCLPFSDTTFDGVVCSSVIEYLDDPNAALAELSRVLKPGGILLISAPNRQSPLRLCLKLAYAISAIFSANPWPKYLSYSINEYSRDGLAQHLELYGFKVRQMDYYSPVGSRFIPSWTGSLLIGMAVKSFA